METTITGSRINSLISLYDIHTKYFLNVLEGISDNDAHNRLNTKANHIAWIAGSLVHQRYDLARLFGSDLKQSSYELFKDFKAIQDNFTYPSLSEYKKEWDKISPILRDLLLNVSDEKLDSIFEMPEMKMSHFDLIAYNIHREAYCIGQIGLWRRLLGYEPMKYN